MWSVRFEEVTKRYRRGGAHYPSLRGELGEFARRVGGQLRRRPVEPIGKLALDDVSFEIEEGEAFGMIGPNGAGKTTALRLISRISPPTRGRVRVRGRVGALMEVSAGFQPDLSGRENIWLYGSILGIPRTEIARRFDEIVEFSELPDAIDTQVKYYSSGMKLRLGFAVASHLEPDVFVVDEALAVGDAGFQAKCVERMSQLTREGTTLLFVSHQLMAMETVCDRAIFMLDGKIHDDGPVRDVLTRYMQWYEQSHEAPVTQTTEVVASRYLRLESATCHDRAGERCATFAPGEDLEVRLRFQALTPIESPYVTVGIKAGRNGMITACSMLVDGAATPHIHDRAEISCVMRDLPLRPRTYELWAGVQSRHGIGHLLDWQRIGAFRVATADQAEETGPLAVTAGWPVEVEHEWAVRTDVDAPARPSSPT
jgi:ABC-type polysaccharide/polyol phosphate transport system ATPase subunit